MTLNPPTRITATGAQLSWSAYVDPSTSPNDDLIEYQIHRRPNGSSSLTPMCGPVSWSWCRYPSRIAVLPSGTTSYQDTSAPPTPADDPSPQGKAYDYWVVVKTRDGQVSASQAQAAWLPKAGRTKVIVQAGTTDTTLSKPQPTANLDVLDGRAWLGVGNNSTTYGVTRALAKFPTTAVPAGATVLDAELSLRGGVGSFGTGTATYNVHKLTHAFNETVASWNNAGVGTPWATTGGGGDFDPAVLASQSGFVPTTDEPQWRNWKGANLNATVQGWVNTPSSNFGFLLKTANETTQTQRTLFMSSEAAEPVLRPRLTVTYTERTPENTYHVPTTPERMDAGDTTTVPVTVTNTTAQTLWGSGACPLDQYKASYFANTTLSGAPAGERCEGAIDNNWASGGPTGVGVGADNFSVRWVKVQGFAAGTYTFSATADDGVRVFLDGVALIDQWKDQPPTTYTVSRVVSAGDHELKVEYYERGSGATARFSVTAGGTCPVGHYQASYFANTTLTGTAAGQRCEGAIDNDWGTGGPTGVGVGADNFSVRWVKTQRFSAGTYTFSATVDDGVRVFLDGVLVIDQWRAQAPTTYTVSRSVTAGNNTSGQQTSTTVTSAGGSSSRGMTFTYHPDGKVATRTDEGVPVGRHVVLVDNSDDQNVTATGTWPTATSGNNFQGFDYRTHAAGTGTATFAWTLHIPQSGTYEVFAKYPTGATATNAPYRVEHAGGSTTRAVNQTAGAGTWVSLGSFSFGEGDGGSGRRIVLSDDANGTVFADAVKLVRDNGGDTDAERKVITYRYDPNGNLVRTTDSSSGAQVDTYVVAYDGLNRVDKVEERNGGVNGTLRNTTRFTYDPNGNVATRLHDDEHAAYVYDVRDMVDTATNGASATDPDPKVTRFTYTPRGQKLRETKDNGNTVDHTYFLDALLKTQVEKKASGALVNSHTLTYTPNGDRLTDVAKTQNADNHAAFLDHTFAFTYDPLDRTISRTKDAGSAGEKRTDFNYLGLSGEVLSEEIAGQIQVAYQYSPWGERLSQIKFKPGGVEEDSFYGYNPHSDVEALTDQAGDTRATYGYTAYGKDDKEAFTGIDKPDVQDPSGEPYNVYRFNAKRFDPATGEYDMGFRDYDPDLNRFLSRDMFNGALSDLSLTVDPWNANRYAFAGGNPITIIELDGHWGWSNVTKFVSDHKAEIVGAAVGFAVGVGCTALTGGAGALGCAALGGAVGSMVTHGMTTDEHTIAGYAQAGVIGAASGLVGYGAGRLLQPLTSRAGGAIRGLFGRGGGAADDAAAGAAAGAPARFVQSTPSSQALRESMEAAGQTASGDFQAHHIVAGGSWSGRNAATQAAARRAQDKLTQLGIDINDAANGVYLPGGWHQSVHTNAYLQMVDRELARATTRDEGLAILRRLGQELHNRWLNSPSHPYPRTGTPRNLI